MTGNKLKQIALSTMFLDHFAASYLWKSMVAEGLTAELNNPMNMSGTAWTYLILRAVGRIAFPIYLFLLTEGVSYTKNMIKYILTLGVFAIISEIPFDLALWLDSFDVMEGNIFYWNYQNVFFTLMLAVIAMALVKKLEEKQLGKLVFYAASAWIFVIAAAIAYIVKCDYEYAGILAAGAIYLLRKNRMLAVTAGVLILAVLSSYSELFALPIVWIIGSYTGERGKKVNKYWFYAFYPAHLLVLFAFCYFMGV